MNSNNGVRSPEAEAIEQSVHVTSSTSAPEATAIVDIDTVATVLPQKTTIGPYVLERELGQGAMGAVYLATHSRLKRKVALKVLPANLTTLPGRLSRFRHEMEAVGRLDHPNIVQATDAGDAEGVYYLAMELVNGLDLGKIIEQTGSMDCGAACEVARQTALGLQHIHENRLVHRDIKPSNLMLNSQGQVKILDLGIAMLRDHDGIGTMTSANAVMGTPDYMAPEQVLENRDVDIRADIYSLGCTLYSLLAGRPPFDGPGYESQVEKLVAHGTQAPLPLSSFAPDTPKELIQVVDRLMSKSREDRYQNPQEVVDALAPWADASRLQPLVSLATSHGNVPSRVAAETSDDRRKRTVREYQMAPRTKKTKLHRYFGPGVLATVLILGAALFFLPGRSSSEKDVANGPTPDSAAAGGTSVGNHDTTSADDEAQRIPLVAGDDVTDALANLTRDTRAIRSSTRELAVTNENIDVNTRQIAETLETIRETFEAIADTGGIIARPESPSEFYHNARLYETQGNYASARDCYLRFLESGAAFVDVHHRFQKFLKLQEGLAGARQTYRQIGSHLTGPVGQYATALLQEPDECQRQLADLVSREPDFAPAFYKLSRLSSEANVGDQSLADKAQEKELLEQFLALHERGYVVRYFLDQSEAASMIQDAEQRMASLNSLESRVFQHPVSMVCSKHRHGWNLAFRIAEPAREILYRVGSSDEFRSTGLLDQTDPKTGAFLPQTIVSLPEDAESCQIEVKYTDLRGNQRGPYAIPFDPAIETIRHAKRTLEVTKHSWLSFGKRQNSRNLYFTHLAIYRDAIAEVRYAVNQDQPTTRFELPDLNGRSSQKLWVQIPPETQYAVVQVTFQDGTRSEIVRIERPQP